MASSLKHELSAWYGRAVIVARGADDARAAAERALEGSDPSLALRHARDLLARVPRSPVGLLLAADAAEACLLDDDACDYLGQLAEVVPWAGEVWLRLGLARLRAGRPPAEARDALTHALTDDASPDVAARAAVALADVDLAAGDATRALAWLERVSDAADPAVHERRAIALLDQGEVERAREVAARLSPPGPLDGRRALLFGRLSAYAGGDALPFLVRAFLLDEPGAARALAAYIASGAAPLPERVREVLVPLGDLGAPIFRAAFAQARGDREGSLEALSAAADAGDLDAARVLCAQAVESRDAARLRRAHDALARGGIARSPVEVSLVEGAERLERGDVVGALDCLDGAGEHPWGAALRQAAFAAYTPEQALCRLDGILAEVRRAARTVDDATALVATEAIAVEAERPLRVAIMGEFNAGKSTFVNALLGADIAPTGVLPTTATLHHVVFSPDPFARITIRKAPERVVSPERLRAALAEVQGQGGLVTRVTVGLPLERLRHIELIDTPGFNAPNADHAAAARDALAEVHLSLWLLDASQPWKGSERAVLEEVRAAGVPVQVLINKLDRVGEGDRDRVLTYVGAKLVEVGITSLRPLIAFSARQALAGRLGDEDALGRSGWRDIEALVEQVVVAQAPLLKDAAIRRRVRALVGPLLAQSVQLSAAELSTARRDAEVRAALVQAASLLPRSMQALGREVGRACDEARQALSFDIAPLVQGAAQGGDLKGRAYIAQRAVLRLAPPLARAVASVATEPPHRESAEAAVRPAVEAALHGLVTGLERPTDVPQLVNERLAEAVVPPASAALAAAAAHQQAHPRLAAPLALRLAALHEALAPR